MNSLEGEQTIRKHGGRNRLISYAFLREEKKPYAKVFNQLLENKVYDTIMIDSGAFSASRGGKPIDNNKYIEFAKSYNDEKDLFFVGLDKTINLSKCDYAGADVFEANAKETLTNCREMLRAGVMNIPSLHMGEPLDYLKYMVDEFPYVALSITSSRAYSLFDRTTHLDNCWNIIPKGTKVHAFGVTDVKIPLMYPWTSVDSATWAKEALYGKIKTIHNGAHDTIAVSERSKETRHYELLGGEEKQEIDKYLAELGSSYEKVKAATPAGLDERCRVNIQYFIRSLERERITINRKQEVLF